MAFKFFIYFFVVYVLFGEIFHQNSNILLKYSFKEKEDGNSSFDCIINNVLIL